MNKNKLLSHQIKSGDKLSRLSYIKVLNVFSSAVEVQNEEGVKWTIDKAILEKECYSANQFTETKIVNRSELIEIFNKTGDNIYTVSFNKQAKLADAFDAVCNKGKLKSNAVLKKELSEAMSGEERTLIGYTISREIAWGRSMVIDLETEDTNRIRQVDHRTLNWLICQNVKYIVKD